MRMLTLEIVFALLLGLAVGSFLNVCISRLPQHASVVWPASHCPHCHAPITARDNIPLLSFAMLGGRCRHCRAPISWRYPLVELAAAALGVANLLVRGLSPAAAAISVFCLALLALAVTDAETMRLPDSLTLPLLATGILSRAAGLTRLGGLPEWRGALVMAARATLAAAVTALALLLLRWLYAALRGRQGMGMGDVKLAAAIAAWLGARQMLVVLFLAVMSAAVIGILLLARRDRKSARPPGPPEHFHRRRRGTSDSFRGFSFKKSHTETIAAYDSNGEDALALPFGIFLASAGIYAAFFGSATLDWYLGLFR